MGYAQVCAVVRGCAWCVWVWGGEGVRGYAPVCACVWDEFSDFLPKNRVPTSVDFNTYSIQIFYQLISLNVFSLVKIAKKKSKA